MRISVRGRYALATLIHIAQYYDKGNYLTALSISETLGISKIYLEQVFSILKRSKIVISVKGSQGGYQLSRDPKKITIYDILSAVESSFFEKTETTVSQRSPEIEQVMQSEIFNELDRSIISSTKKITLYELMIQVSKLKANDGYMYHI